MKFSGIVALRELSWISIEIFEMFNFGEVMNQNVTTFLFTNFDQPLVIFHLAQKISNLMQYPLLNLFSKENGELTACGSRCRVTM